MAGAGFSGNWVFEAARSELSFPPPLAWLQRVTIEGDRIRVQEQITRASGTSTVEVDAAFDGKFYAVSGSPIADEIAYTWEGEAICGTGRKNGIVLLREVIELQEAAVMTMTFTLVVNGKETSAATAYFRRAA